jgi:hypothetical protein
MTEPDSADDHAYFQAIEEIFVRLRGAPLLLSPADWQVARRWHRDGVPLDLVRRALEEVFAKRQERGTKGKISSLRYCAPAVEAAWADLRELTAPGERTAAPPLDIAARLAALAAALPAGHRDAFASRIQALEGGPPAPQTPQTVEERLATLDLDLLEAALAALDEAARAEVDAAVGKTLAALAPRLPAEELARSRERLARQILRQRLRLPLLSLFSPEAEEP